MKKYTKSQKSKLKVKTFCAEVNGTWTYVRAYSKANALHYLQAQDAEVTDVKTSKLIFQGAIDHIAETEFGVFEVVMDKFNKFGDITNSRDI